LSKKKPMSFRFNLSPHFDAKRQRWILNIPPAVSKTGKRSRLIFASREEALKASKQMKKRIHWHGRGLNALTPHEMAEADTALELLREAGIKTSPLSIIEQYIAAVRDRSSSVPLGRLFEEYIQARDHKTDDYLLKITYCKRRFEAAGLLRKAACDLTAEDCAVVLQPLPDAQYNADLRYLRAVLNWGLAKKGWLKANPALRLEFRHRRSKEPEIISNPVVEAMLLDALNHRLELLPILTVGFFTGIRIAEMKRLSWDHLNLDRKEIIVPAAISKTGVKRFPPISDNALAWLERCQPHRSGQLVPFTPQTLRSAREANWAAATAPHQLKYPQNALRHSFATNWVNYHQRLDQLALILGHTSTVVSFKHYVGGTPYSEAEHYWAIYPPPLSPAEQKTPPCLPLT
jgi:integrase